jgi:hypothetical protein
VTLDEIDQTLSGLRQSAEMMAANLFELDNDPNRKLLDQGPLSGLTAVRWEEANEALARLWQWFTWYKETLDRAVQLRGTKGRLDAQRLAELEQLLTGPSIELSREQVPLAQRGLFGAAETTVHCTLQDLLARMSETFDRAKAVVGATGEAWSRLLPRLQAARSELVAADELASGLGERHVPELDQVRSRLADLTVALAGDPLSVDPDAIASVSTTLAAIHRDLDELARLRDTVVAHLEQARLLLADLEEAVEAAADSRAETALKIASPQMPNAPLLDPSFGRSLDRVTALAARSEWRAARRQLTEWTGAAKALLANAERIREACRAPIEQRDELRGRLDAYRAKANRLGLLEDTTLSVWYDEAHRALYTAPTDLVAAGDLVRRYQEGIPLDHSPDEVPS